MDSVILIDFDDLTLHLIYMECTTEICIIGKRFGTRRHKEDIELDFLFGQEIDCVMMNFKSELIDNEKENR